MNISGISKLWREGFSSDPDYWQTKLDDGLLALHLPSIAVPGSTNAKIYETCREKCGESSRLSYTDVAEALRLKEKVQKTEGLESGKWSLYSTTWNFCSIFSQHLVSINGKNEVIIHCRDRGKVVGEGSSKTAYVALWLQEGQEGVKVESLAELVAKDPCAAEMMLKEEKQAEESKLSLTTTGSLKVFDHKESPEVSLLQTMAENDLEKYYEEPTLSAEEILGKSLKMARSIEEFHSRGYVHRDIKPANFLEYEDGSIKLTDWGTVTRERYSQAVAGTRYFLAPELQPKQAFRYKTSGKYTTNSDIYSLGMSFRVFYGREAGGEIKHKGMLELISWMCHEDPLKRPSASQVVKELERLCKEIEEDHLSISRK